MRTALIVVVLLVARAYSRKLPSFIEVCHRHDPKMKECLRKNIEILKPRFNKGIPELHIPSLDPLVVPEATLEGGENFKATFSDIKIYDALEFVLESFDVKVGKEELQLEASLSFPHLRIKSHYKLNGKILILELNGEGMSVGNYTNIAVHFMFKGKTFKKNGNDHIKLTDRSIDLKIEKTIFEFENLFRDKELNDQTNKIINDNAEGLVKELTPVVTEVIGKFVFGIVNQIFDMFPYDELFPDP